MTLRTPKPGELQPGDLVMLDRCPVQEGTFWEPYMVLQVLPDDWYYCELLGEIVSRAVPPHTNSFPRHSLVIE